MAESYGQANKYAGLPAGSAQPISKDSLPMVAETFDKEIERLEHLRNSLGQLADNLAGARPAPASTDMPESLPHCLVDRLQRLRRRMDAALSACEHERDRISQALS